MLSAGSLRACFWAVRTSLLSSLSLATARTCLPAGRFELFQYALDFEYIRRDKTRTGRAHLWIPPKARRVHGVVLAGFTSMERRFVKNGRIRQACQDESLAIVFTDTGLSALDVPELLARFAAVSGYGELPRAPLLLVGHSAGGPQARDLARAYAERCFGLIQHRGGLADGVPPEVPAIAAVGQFDEFAGQMELQAVSDSGLAVEYYVESGPAKVVDGRLFVSELPARARVPIEVRVVAYQFGSGIAPRYKTAEPVVRTFRITRPE
jgi:hypothetical protein